MKHYLTITSDNYNEALENVALLYQNCVFDNLLLDKGEIEKEFVSLLATVIIRDTKTYNEVSSPFSELDKNKDNEYFIVVDKCHKFYVYTKKDMTCVDTFKCSKDVSYNSFINTNKFINSHPLVQMSNNGNKLYQKPNIVREENCLKPGYELFIGTQLRNIFDSEQLHACKNLDNFELSIVKYLVEHDNKWTSIETIKNNVVNGLSSAPALYNLKYKKLIECKTDSKTGEEMIRLFKKES